MWRRCPRSPCSIPCFRLPLRLPLPPPSWTCGCSPSPRAPAPGSGHQYHHKGQRCWHSDKRGFHASVVGGQVHAAWEMAQEASRSIWGRKKPSPILTPPPAVAPSALPPRVPTLARPHRQDRSGAGRVPGATAAPLDRLLGPSAWETHRRNITKLPVGVPPFRFCTPNGPAAVADRNTPPAIARPSLLPSEIAGGLLHQELTPIAHSLRPLSLRRLH